MMKKVFTLDPTYKEMNAVYGKMDTFLAVGYYFLLMLLYMCAGIVLVTWGVYLNVYVNILSIIICIAIVG